MPTDTLSAPVPPAITLGNTERVRQPSATGNLHYTHRFSDLHYRNFGGRGASTVGMGACRERGEEDPAAIVAAVRLGCNVLDTAPYYHQGAHEQCVGQAV